MPQEVFYISKFSSRNRGLSRNSLNVISNPPAISMAVERRGRIPAENPTASQLKLKALLETMLTYGAASQKYFNYNTDRLATDEYFKITVSGGHLDDYSTKGMFKDSDVITLIADADEELYDIVLEDSEGQCVDTGKVIAVTVRNSAQTYTAKITLKSAIEGAKTTSVEKCAPNKSLVAVNFCGAVDAYRLKRDYFS